MNEQKWLKAELHAHTLDDPEDGGRLIRHSARQLIDESARQGFDVLAITNHNQQLFDGFLADYARDRGVLLVPGVEATLDGKHVLLYNFPDYSPSWNSFEEVARKKKSDSLVVAPHPFFPSTTSVGRGLFHWRRIFDAVEYNHFFCRG